MAEYGRPEEDFGRIAINARRWSALNPRAVMRDELTMDDYLSSRMVADPLRVLDCDYPVNGAVATLITTAERAADLRHHPVLVDAMAYATGRGADWIFDTDFLYGGARDCADRLWRRSSVTAADVDVAQVYDGFTPVAVAWIEALGACGRGEFGDWWATGAALAPAAISRSTPRADSSPRADCTASVSSTKRYCNCAANARTDRFRTRGSRLSRAGCTRSAVRWY